MRTLNGASGSACSLGVTLAVVLTHARRLVRLTCRLTASDVAIKYLKTDKELLTDPFALVRDEMADINGSIKKILGTDHPVLSAVAKYFFEHDGGKKVRPTMVLLIAHAAEAHRAAVGSPLPTHQSPEFTLAAQRRIAEITYVHWLLVLGPRRLVVQS